MEYKSILERPVGRLYEFLFPEVSLAVEAMLEALEGNPDDWHAYVEKDFDLPEIGRKYAYLQLRGTNWFRHEVPLVAMRFRLSDKDVWLDMPSQKMVPLNRREKTLVMQAIKKWTRT